MMRGSLIVANSDSYIPMALVMETLQFFISFTYFLSHSLSRSFFHMYINSDDMQLLWLECDDWIDAPSAFASVLRKCVNVGIWKVSMMCYKIAWVELWRPHQWWLSDLNYHKWTCWNENRVQWNRCRMINDQRIAIIEWLVPVFPFLFASLFFPPNLFPCI